mmetsp:Transcript_16216/g.21103  ORF Transcript_16216/g.21103 Transcript_16216/m.21103 type:complete len:174 (+) Transcript_16216:65-586(+)
MKFFTKPQSCDLFVVVMFSFLFIHSCFSYSHSTKSIVGPSFFNDDHGVGLHGNKCPLGTYHEDGQCHSCPRGTYGDSNDFTSELQCKHCPAGTYRDQVGGRRVEDCLPCPAGTYGVLEGLVSPTCTDYCPKGKYSLEEGLTKDYECKTCPDKYFNWQCRDNKKRQAKFLSINQ